jgi:outer membrane receptor protein involved in Fe transport
MRTQLALALSIALSLPLLAQAPPKKIGEVTLFGEEQLKVEAATKTEIPISKAPSAVTVVTAKQIRESGARSVPDLLRLVAGVNVRWNPMTQTIDIRGFGENPFANRVLILIDGAPVNSGDTGGFPLSPAFDLFPVETIKRVEVVRGPGSSLYGENAYWGVINIVTLSGEDLAGGQAQLFGGARSTGLVNAMYGRKTAGGSYLASVRAYQSQMPQEFWTDDQSKVHGTDIFLKGSHGDWQGSLYRHDDHLDGFAEEFPAGLGLPPGSQFASAHDLIQALTIASLRYNHSPANAAVTYSADLSWAHRNGMHCAGCHAAQETPAFSHRADHGYQAIGDFRAGLHMIPAHDILVGLEARRLDRAEHKEELAADVANAASGYDKVAVYAQDQWDVLPNRLRVIGGIRYDRRTKLFDSKTSPRLAFIYTPNDKLVLRGGYSSAFRFPTFSELYQASWFLGISNDELPVPPFPLSHFQPNPNLKPEEISTFDVGGEYQLSPTMSLKADLYRSRVSNFIVIVQNFLAALPSFGWENQPADARIMGGEVELRANVTGAVTGFVNYAHETESQLGAGTDSSGHPFEFVYAPKDKVNAGAYFGPFNNVRGAVEASWKSRYDTPSDWAFIRSNFTSFAAAPQPSYTLLNARVSYDLPLARSHPIRFTLFGNNLLNKRPEETIVGSENRLVGREFFGQLEVNF